MQEIVEELPEDADLSTDPGHMEQLVSESSSEATPSPVVTPSPSPAIPPAAVAQSKVGPEPLAVRENDLGPSPVSIRDERETEGDPQTPQTPTPPDMALSPMSDIQSPLPDALPSPISDIQSPVREQKPAPVSNGKAETKGRGDDTSLSSELSGTGNDKAGKREEHKYATLSRVRKFKVDGQVMQSTTRKIVDVTANRTLRDNRKYQEMR